MSSALLATKLHIPKLRRPHLSRPRLLDRLRQGGKLTLLSAPAGYGKSTLLAEYVAASENSRQTAAWLTLDEADNDLRRFLRYLLAAFAPVAPVVEAAPAEALTALLNALGEEHRVTLVLDDYQLIDNAEVHEAVRFMVEHAPPALRLILSTRRDPPLPLSRWRARGELNELRVAELRFMLEEARAFLSQVMGLELLERDSRELERRTEGWVAGLQLAALSLRGNENVSDYIERFTGTDRYILDYLTEEVLVHQPAQVQNFLMLTSILERLCGSLCDAVSEQLGGQEMLERLERSNLFILPLDHERRWYRYHAFFADLLRYRLQRARPDLVPVLHLRASTWFEAQQQPALALHHALLAEDFSRAAALIHSHPRVEAIRRALLALSGEGDTEQPLAALLKTAAARGVSPLVQGRLWAAFEGGEKAPGVLEPLSERELEVLRLLAAGLSNKAIAARLGVSVNTIKTHVKNILAKLGVRNRTEAGAKARALNLQQG